MVWSKVHSSRERKDWDLTVTLSAILLIFVLFLKEIAGYPARAEIIDHCLGTHITRALRTTALAFILPSCPLL